jgi:chromate transport protein ChrA
MANFLVRPAAAIGAMLAIATIPLHLYLSKPHSEQFSAVLLAGVGAVCVGFGLQKGNRSQMATEILVATGFFAALLAGLWVSAWIVPFGWAVHGIWDYAHHQDSKPTPKSWKFVAIPPWYPPFCAVADWAVAPSLAVIWSLRL